MTLIIFKNLLYDAPCNESHDEIKRAFPEFTEQFDTESAKAASKINKEFNEMWKEFFSI
jgi:hypothetical protein